MNPEILTSSGVYFNLINPEPEQVRIEDIAASLSKLCRFTGHTKMFYSVAQHSVIVAMNAPLELKMHALLHDASEAYLGDVSSPLKQLLPAYKALEYKVHNAITRHFNLRTLSIEECTLLGELDARALKTERNWLMYDPQDRVWEVCEHLEPFNVQYIQTLQPWQAEHAFLQQFHKLSRLSGWKK